MSTYEALKYNFNGSALTNIVSIEVGTILPWSNSSLPSGYLNCDGTAVSRTTYSALFAVIGTDYGVGNGSSTFNLPDLQDKVPVGVSGSKAVASTGGAATVTPTGSITINALTPAGSISGSTSSHTLSTSEIPSHYHRDYAANITYPNPIQDAQEYNSRYVTSFRNNQSTGGGGSHSHGMSATFSGNAVTPTGTTSINAVSTLQPYVAIKFMIKV
tara:strand:+ start:306 stop:950 length:645 start_codon:yes stop_codon:yes gene_type:complete